ncbi:hypothetical protein M5689_002698 [Euphorbia peplus]|nr:hypothetical protein M5689_002698 [Euphorbia peplus]
MGEIDENIFEGVQIEGKQKTKIGKPPTRLQKKAPTSLEVTDYVTNNLHHSLRPLTPIPLLSPVISRPTDQEFRFPIVEAIKNTNQPNPYNIDPSSLLTVFRNKCVLVNHVDA